jgi:Zn-dependent protease with chaperone function
MTMYFFCQSLIVNICVELCNLKSRFFRNVIRTAINVYLVSLTLEKFLFSLMASVKWKFFLILVLSMFATAGASFYLHQHQPSPNVAENSIEQHQQVSTVQNAQKREIAPERYQYQKIPLNEINSTLHGSDPATLALNAVQDQISADRKHKVEVVYPEQNQALVKITQTLLDDDAVDTINYRVEMTTFGRSLLVSSPPIWQIVWAGSQTRCRPGSRLYKGLAQSCQ